MKMEKKQCTKCRQPLSLDCFRINKRTAQWIRRYSKCLDKEKIYKENRKCEHRRIKKFVANAKEVKFVTTTNEDQPVVTVMENRFARTICNYQSVLLAVVVPFANITWSGQSVEAVTEDLFASMKK